MGPALFAGGLLAAMLALAVPGSAQWRTGYFMQGEAGGQTAATIPWAMYTHVIQYAMQPKYADGVCSLDGKNAHMDGASIAEFIGAAHAAGVKASLGIAEDGLRTDIQECTKPWNIAQFVELVSGFVREHQYDGVDFGWLNDVTAIQYQDLIWRLREALPEATLSVPARTRDLDVVRPIQGALDQINLLAYGLDPASREQGDRSLESGEPGAANGLDPMFAYYATAAGIPPAKIGIGVPFFGRVETGCQGYGDAEGAIRSKAPRDLSREFVPYLVPYRDLVQSRYWSAATHVWDAFRQSEHLWYTGRDCATDAFIPYGGVEQMQAAVAQIKALVLGGIMTFGMPYEYLPNQPGNARYPLSSVISEAMAPGDTSTALTEPQLRLPGIAKPVPAAGSPLVAQLDSRAAASGSHPADVSDPQFTYYVDSTGGADSNPGTKALPWKTVAKVNSTHLRPGESVGFKRGGLWRETLVPRQSGSAGHPIRFDAYGSGALPTLDGSDVVTSWTRGTGNAALWSAATAVQPYAVWFDGALGTRKASTAALKSDKDWYWKAGRLNIYSTTNPNRYKNPGVESAHRENVLVNNLAYVTLNGLAFAHGGNADNGGNSVRLRQSQNIVLSNCAVTDSVNIGVGIANVNGTTGDTLIEACTFRGTGESMSPLGAPSGIQTYNTGNAPVFTVENCTFQDMDAWGFHHGHGVYHQSGQLIWRNNFHYGDRGTTEAGAGAGAAVRLASPGGATVYNNIFSNQGGRRYWGILINHSGTNNIYNNDFYENNYGVVTESGGSTNHIVNNIFCCNARANQWYYVNDTGRTYAGAYNLFYGSGTVWIWGGASPINALKGWQAASAEDAHSITANPLLNNPSGGDFSLREGSPAIGAGVYIPGVSTAKRPNIGAK